MDVDDDVTCDVPVNELHEIVIKTSHGSLGTPWNGLLDVNRERLAGMCLKAIKIDEKVWSHAVEPHLVQVLNEPEPWVLTRCAITDVATYTNTFGANKRTTYLRNVKVPLAVDSKNPHDLKTAVPTTFEVEIGARDAVPYFKSIAGRGFVVTSEEGTLLISMKMDQNLGAPRCA